MKKISTVAGEAEQEYFWSETDHRTGSGRSISWYCVLDEAGEVRWNKG